MSEQKTNPCVRRYIIEPEETPKILFKYAPWDKNRKDFENIEKLVTRPQIYFARPTEFNDPYDCKIYTRFDCWSLDDFKKSWRQIIQKHNPQLGREDVENEVEKLSHEHIANPEQAIEGIKSRHDQFYEEDIGIQSLSETKKSILMWSHYSNSHKGICIGYETEKIQKYTNENVKSLNPDSRWVHFHKVNYNSEYPVIFPSNDSIDPTIFLYSIKTKYIDWSYEKEWRLAVGVRREGRQFSEREVPITIDAIAEINFGYRMTRDNIESIISKLTRQNYGGKLYQASQKEYSYQLTFEEINL